MMKIAYTMKRLLLSILTCLLITTSSQEAQEALYLHEKVNSTTSKPGYRPVIKSQGEGSTDGDYFDDTANISATIVNIYNIGIMSMYQVDLLQLSYILANGSLYNSSCHGSSILFYPDNYTLEKGEYVEKIEGSTSDELVNQLTITLNQPSENSKRVIGPYGTTIGKKNFTFEGYIFAFHGRTGKYVLQNIGVYYIPPAKKTAYFGPPSQDFKEDPDAMNPPVVKVSKIIIHHSNRINSLQFEYRLHGGARRLGRQYPIGPVKGVLTTLVFSDNEWLIGAYGKIRKGWFHSQIQITFVTRKADGSRSQYGPYGGAYNDDVISTTKFNMTGTIIGYWGYFNNGLNSVGFFYF